ncbi:hypothetical protein [Nocardia sp. NPDC004260]
MTQYPEARASLPLPVIGRAAATLGGGAASRAAYAEGRLSVGSHMTVPREELVLDYTVVAADDSMFTDALAADPVMAARLRCAGVDLASASVEWWREPGIVERVRNAPYPRLHALLDGVGQAPVHIDGEGNWFFQTAPEQRARLDELLTV